MNKKITMQIKQIVKQQPQLIILIILIIIFASLLPMFTSVRNVLNIFKQITVIALIGSGLTLVLIGGNVDLSVGSTMSLLCILSLKMQLINTSLGIVVPIALAVVIGLFNGYIVYKFNINSVVVTIGTMTIIAGAAYLLSGGGTVIGKTGTAYSLIANTKILGIPSYIFIFIIIAIICEILLRSTTFGRSLFYQGTNREAANIAGVNVMSTTILSFVICSVTVAIAAIVLSSRTLTATPIVGRGLEFEVLTAVLLGGISLAGGKGNIFRTMIGILLLALIINGMNLLLIHYEYQSVAKGFLIIIAVIYDAISRHNYEG